MKKLLILALALTSCNAPLYTKNADRLAVAYYQAGESMDCGEKEIQGRAFILCKGIGTTERDLWLVEGDRIYAVNGSARSELPKLGSEFAEYPNPTEIDIKAVLDKF